MKLQFVLFPLPSSAVIVMTCCMLFPLKVVPTIGVCVNDIAPVIVQLSLDVAAEV